MILDFALLADRATGKEGGKVDVIGGGIGHVTASEVPTTLPALAMVVRLLLEDSDPRGERQIAFRIRNRGGDDLLTSPSFTIDPWAQIPKPTLRAGDRAALVLVMQLGQVVFPDFGAYQIELLFDGEVFTTKDLAVMPDDPRRTRSSLLLEESDLFRERNDE